MNDPVVRSAVSGDVDAWLALRVSMFDAMGQRTDEPAWQDAARAWFAAVLDDPDVLICVVEDEGRVVAAAQAVVMGLAPSPGNPRGRQATISNVSTLPAFRGRGHGRRAFEDVLRRVEDETDAGLAELHATDAGRGMYEQAGFGPAAWPTMRMRIRRA